MAKINAKASCNIEFSITVNLTLSEALALQALACYGTDAFLKVFYEKMGKAYLGPHENGLINLFSIVKNEMSKEIDKVESAKESIGEAMSKF